MMKLIFVRHGDSVEVCSNIDGESLCDKALTEKGIEQAYKAGIYLKRFKIDRIFSSDMIRAVQTTSEINKTLKIKDIILDARIRERRLGSYIKSRKEIDWKRVPIKFPQGAEVNSKMKYRIKSFLDELLNNYKDSTVLIVSHEGVMKFIVNLFYNMPLNSIETVGFLDHCSVSVFNIKNKKIDLLLWNYSKFLSN